MIAGLDYERFTVHQCLGTSSSYRLLEPAPQGMGAPKALPSKPTRVASVEGIAVDSSYFSDNDSVGGAEFPQKESQEARSVHVPGSDWQKMVNW